MHPAVLDAAAHAALAASEPDQPLRLPFSFAGVSLGESEGATSLRARVRLGTERVEIALADTEGGAVCEIEALSVREVDPAALRAHAPRRSDLYAVEWEEVELAELDAPPGEELPVHTDPDDLLATMIEPGESPAGLFVFSCAGSPRDTATEAARSETGRTLTLLQAFLAGERLAGSRLAILTRGAVAALPGESPDPAMAAVWGLVRSAQLEHPGRLLLLDTDASEGSKARLAAAMASGDEPQIALRGGVALAPRLARVEADRDNASDVQLLDPARTVLVTGGLSGLGALTARHLAKRHGAGHLLLAGRRGPQTPGADELIAELAELGCEARAVACDASDREQLETLLASIPAVHPLGAVVHCAGVLDDGLVADLTPQRFDAVLAAKADAAWHLHELTRGIGLSHFVLFSSASGAFGSPGQGNYAAANAFLEALAQLRHAEGLPAGALGWGSWRSDAGMTARLGEADQLRRRRFGLDDLDAEEGMQLLDASLPRPEAVLMPVRLNRAGLRRQAEAGMLPPLFAGLVPATRRRGDAADGSLLRRLRGAQAEERGTLMLEFVRGEIAAVLGHGSAAAVAADAAFKDLGFDSLGAVELRNRLVRETAAQLDATVVFDHPTPEAIAAHLLARMDLAVPTEADAEEAEVRRLISAIPTARLRDSGLLEQLRALAGDDEALPHEANGEESAIDSMDVEDLVRRTLGSADVQEVGG